ncbi:MAG: phosphotransferase [Gammaproteobacteria bacterium]|jgi:thiamine kinase-like enzyme|nr:phosphotransferase [Gammaproteobacteria bacterium]
MTDAKQTAAKLSCWKNSVDPQPLTGGITNANFIVDDAGERYFVRVGDDIPLHGVMRFNELAASRAAYEVGLSPEVIHHEFGAMVMRFIDGTTLRPSDIRQPANLERIVSLVRRCHDEIPKHFRGPALVFWVFQVLRDYANTLREASSRMVLELPRLMKVAEQLEESVGPVRLRFGHNDLLAANFIDDGKRLWLVDWDYAGFNSPLFDLGGLASNNELSSTQEQWLLETYFDAAIDDELRRRYAAMKCASLLRESMWSMVSEVYSNIDFDYVGYTTENLDRFEKAWTDFQTN